MASGRSASNKDAYYEKNEFGAYVRPLQPKAARMAVVLYPNSLRSHDRTAAILADSVAAFGQRSIFWNRLIEYG